MLRVKVKTVNVFYSFRKLIELFRTNVAGASYILDSVCTSFLISRLTLDDPPLQYIVLEFIFCQILSNKSCQILSNTVSRHFQFQADIYICFV